MARKQTSEEFIEKARQVHGDKFDYSKTHYTRTSDKITVTCPSHGDFLILPNNFLKSNHGCPKCAKESLYSTEKFLKKAREVHGDTYLYDRVGDVKHSRQYIEVGCKVHGYFKQKVCNHVRGKTGCPQCSLDRRRLTKEDFIKRAKEVHGDKYNYDLVDYTNIDAKVKIICPEHGVFEQEAYSHLKGFNCSLCGNATARDKIRSNTEEFVRRATEVHNGKYDYSNVEYTNNKTLVEIICPNHGSFFQRPDMHLNRKDGCQQCVWEGDSKWKHDVYRSTTTKSYLYLMEVSAYGDRWLKLGISIMPATRIKQLKVELGKGSEINLVEMYSGPGREIYELEHALLFRSGVERMKEDQWEFGGKTECFSYDKLEELKKTMQHAAELYLGVFPCDLPDN